MHIYIYIYIKICMYIYIYMHIYLYVHTYTNLYMYAYVYCLCGGLKYLNRISFWILMAFGSHRAIALAGLEQFQKRS